MVKDFRTPVGGERGGGGPYDLTSETNFVLKFESLFKYKTNAAKIIKSNVRFNNGARKKNI